MKIIINPNADARLHLPCVQTAMDSPARLLALRLLLLYFSCAFLLAVSTISIRLSSLCMTISMLILLLFPKSILQRSH